MTRLIPNFQLSKFPNRPRRNADDGGGAAWKGRNSFYDGDISPATFLINNPIERTSQREWAIYILSDLQPCLVLKPLLTPPLLFPACRKLNPSVSSKKLELACWNCPLEFLEFEKQIHVVR